MPFSNYQDFLKYKREVYNPANRAKIRAHNKRYGEAHREEANSWARARTRVLWEYKTNRGCSSCGLHPHPASMDFHHINGDRGKDVCHLVKLVNVSPLVRDLSRCTILCANCHRAHHYGGVDLGRLTPCGDLVQLYSKLKQIRANMPLSASLQEVCLILKSIEGRVHLARIIELIYKKRGVDPPKNQGREQTRVRSLLKRHPKLFGDHGMNVWSLKGGST